MKIMIAYAVLSALFLAAVAAPARCRTRFRDDSAGTGAKRADEERITLLPKPPKPAVKETKGKDGKKKAKKQAEKPVSEYKFEKIEHTPAYKFDKKTNPIIKEPKPKKQPAKKKGAAKAAPKPKPADDGAGTDDGKLQFPGGGDQQPPPQDQPEE